MNMIYTDENNNDKITLQILETIKREAEEIFKTIAAIEDDELRHRIGHDLKSPKASIEGLINLLKMEVPWEEIAAQIPGLKNNIEKRKDVVKDYVDIHNMIPLITKKMNLQKIIHDPLEETKNIWKYTALIQECGISFDIQIDSEEKDFCEGAVYGICNNLITNAITAVKKNYESIKKNNQDTTITIKRDNKKNTLSIHNYGTIPLNLQEKIFQKWVTTGQETGGTGTGLRSAKSFADNMWLSINFHSNETDGTTFTITFPKKEEKLTVNS